MDMSIVYEVDLSSIEQDILRRYGRKNVNTMNLDRNTTPTGIGKYGLILIRKLTTDDLNALIKPPHPVVHYVPLAAVDLGQGPKGNFFVLRYQDKFAEAALRAYSAAAMEEYNRTGCQELYDLAVEVSIEADKARDHEPKKIPD